MTAGEALCFGDSYSFAPAEFALLLTYSKITCSIFSAPPKKSGRQDLNLRPPGPKPGALAKLSYAPIDRR